MSSDETELEAWLDTAAPLSYPATLWLIHWLMTYGHVVTWRPGMKNVRLPTLRPTEVLACAELCEVLEARLFERCPSMDCDTGWLRVRITSRGLDYYQQHVAGAYRG